MPKPTLKSLKKRPNPRQLAAYGLIIVGLATLGYTLFLYHTTPHRPTRGVSKHSPSAQQSPSSAKPSADAINNYRVAPDAPKYLSIPAISINKVRILALGQRSDNQLAVPGNIYDTGWYRDSAKPGATGAGFIYGHVSNWTDKGVFYDLRKLKSGDIIRVTRGDDTTFTYVVRQSKTYPTDHVDMQEVLQARTSETKALNLMTCAGKVIKGTNDFDHRLVVFAELQ